MGYTLDLGSKIGPCIINSFEDDKLGSPHDSMAEEGARALVLHSSSEEDELKGNIDASFPLSRFEEVKFRAAAPPARSETTSREFIFSSKQRSR